MPRSGGDGLEPEGRELSEVSLLERGHLSMAATTFGRIILSSAEASAPKKIVDFAPVIAVPVLSMSENRTAVSDLGQPMVGLQTGDSRGRGIEGTSRSSRRPCGRRPRGSSPRLPLLWREWQRPTVQTEGVAATSPPPKQRDAAFLVTSASPLASMRTADARSRATVSNFWASAAATAPWARDDCSVRSEGTAATMLIEMMLTP